LAASEPRRYLIQRTFPAGAIDALDAATKRRVNDNNRKLGVTWIHSYLNADKTKSVCVYTAPSEAAVREAAQCNALPIDSMMEMPFILYPE
jgi:hypothetical protein